MENNKDKIFLWVVNWFESNTNATNKELLNSTDKNYFETGWLDSFKFVSFIMDVENNFNINFSNDEFQDRNFSTIIGLVDIVRKNIDIKNTTMNEYKF